MPFFIIMHRNTNYLFFNVLSLVGFEGLYCKNVSFLELSWVGLEEENELVYKEN